MSTLDQLVDNLSEELAHRLHEAQVCGDEVSAQEARDLTLDLMDWVHRAESNPDEYRRLSEVLNRLNGLIHEVDEALDII